MRPAYFGLKIGAPIAYRANPIVLGRKFCAECGRWRAVHDFSPAKRRGGGLCSYCRVCANRRAKRHYHAPHPDQWWELRREYSRIYQQAKRRERGIPATTATRPLPKSKLDRVDPAPLVHMLKTHIAAQQETGNLDFGWRAIARITGIPERRFYGWRHENRSIRVDKADQVAVRLLGVPLELIYPEFLEERR